MGRVGEREESVFANMFRQYRKGELESKKGGWRS